MFQTKRSKYMPRTVPSFSVSVTLDLEHPSCDDFDVGAHTRSDVSVHGDSVSPVGHGDEHRLHARADVGVGAANSYAGRK